MKISKSVLDARYRGPSRGEFMPSGPDISEGIDRSSYLNSKGFQNPGPSPDPRQLALESEVLEISITLEKWAQEKGFPSRESNILLKASRDLIS